MSDKTAKKYSNKQVTRHNRKLQFVRLGLMKVTELGQRKFNQSWADEIYANFDLDQMQTPEVNHREGAYYLMNGQHSVDAVKRFLGDGWEDQNLECWVAEGLSEKEEANRFLFLNNFKNVPSFQKYKVAVTAERPIETDIEHIVSDLGLKTTEQQIPGAIACVSTLIRDYKRDGPDDLKRSLGLLNRAFGDPGLESVLIDGFSMLCHRYNGVLDESATLHSLQNLRGGVNGLLGQAEQLRQKTGGRKSECVAAKAVEIINRDRVGKKKLPSWFK